MTTIIHTHIPEIPQEIITKLEDMGWDGFLEIELLANDLTGSLNACFYATSYDATGDEISVGYENGKWDCAYRIGCEARRMLKEINL